MTTRRQKLERSANYMNLAKLMVYNAEQQANADAGRTIQSTAQWETATRHRTGEEWLSKLRECGYPLDAAHEAIQQGQEAFREGAEEVAHGIQQSPFVSKISPKAMRGEGLQTALLRATVEEDAGLAGRQVLDRHIADSDPDAFVDALDAGQISEEAFSEHASRQIRQARVDADPSISAERMTDEELAAALEQADYDGREGRPRGELERPSSDVDFTVTHD